MLRDETVSSCSHTSPWEGSCVGGAAGPEKGSTPGQESGYGEAVVQETIGWWRTEIIISVDGAAASIRFTLGGDPSTVQQSKGKGGEVQRAVTPPRLTSLRSNTCATLWPPCHTLGLLVDTQQAGTKTGGKTLERSVCHCYSSPSRGIICIWEWWLLLKFVNRNLVDCNSDLFFLIPRDISIFIIEKYNFCNLVIAGNLKPSFSMQRILIFRIEIYQNLFSITFSIPVLFIYVNVYSIDELGLLWRDKVQI